MESYHMDRGLMKARFLALSQTDRELVLLSVLYNLTIAMRDVLHTQTDSTKIDTAKSVSEINHKVLPFIIASRTGKSRYPDDVLFDIVLDTFSGTALLNYLPQIWDASIDTLSKP
jgi:hypothetical protein